MAQRRCLQTVARRSTAVLSSLRHSREILPSLSNSISIKSICFSKSPINIHSTWQNFWPHHDSARNFSSNSRDESENEENDDEEEEEEDNDDEEEEDVDEKDSDGKITASNFKREYSTEEKEAEASAIGYKVVGPLQESDRVFKPYEPVCAVVQIGSHQFKVSNGDCIFTERLKFCEVNDKLNLIKVLLLGSATQTIVGRPIVPEAVVHAVVEEHALDAKVIIFKKKRRKNYRRTKGHRQELTKLRITDIHGIEKPEIKDGPKPKKVAVKKQEKVAVAA